MKPSLLRLLPIGALLLLPQFVHAQYSWVDDKGARVFSDRPPPPGTPAARILKAPRGLEPAPAAAPAAASQPAPAAPAAPDWKKNEADYQKRAAEQAKEEEKAAAAHKARLARCDAARVEQARLNSGARLVNVDKNGEHQYMSDEERARRQKSAQSTIANCP